MLNSECRIGPRHEKDALTTFFFPLTFPSHSLLSLLRLSSLVKQEDRRHFVQVGQLFEPRFHAFGNDALALTGNIGSNAKLDVWRHCFAEVGYQGIVAIGCLDENLRLALAHDALLHLLDFLGTLSAVDGQVAQEGETLSVESRAH